MDFKNRIEKAKKESLLSQEGYFIWGGSVVKDDEGTYHMFASRWEKTKTFKSWVTHSKIIRALACEPDGPFEIKEEVVSLNEQVWSKKMTHNPTVKKIGDLYYLFYLGTTYSDDVPDIPEDVNSHPARYNQRIGVAVAVHPAGPWTPSANNPILKPRPGEWDSTFVTNPSVFVDEGEIRLIYKARYAYQNEDSNKLILGLAVSQNPEGPYVRKGPSPLFDYDVEDPFIWKENNRYYMVVKDMTGSITGKYNGVLMASDNGEEWALAEEPLAWDHNLFFDDGTVEQPYFVERPQLLIEKGRPTCLYTAIGDGKNYAANLARKISLY